MRRNISFNFILTQSQYSRFNHSETETPLHTQNQEVVFRDRVGIEWSQDVERTDLVDRRDVQIRLLLDLSPDCSISRFAIFDFPSYCMREGLRAISIVPGRVQEPLPGFVPRLISKNSSLFSFKINAATYNYLQDTEKTRTAHLVALGMEYHLLVERLQSRRQESRIRNNS